ncbi:DUF4433 domain-containing protein [Lentibacillus salinarum]|uniref:DUF4433 domain-containing protein n=1 Tax=Lentibacillus salinarum TaxID=446820 RepID=A0ABW3ZQB1_9BACI
MSIISDAGKKFVFTDGHAIMALTDFYHDLKDLNQVDWNVMNTQYWNDTNEDPDRKRRRQAEFLVHQSVELDLFLGIGVYNEWMKRQVKDILLTHNIDMYVLVRRNFYF